MENYQTCFVSFDSLRPSQQFFSLDMSGQVFMGCPFNQWIKCLAQGHNTATSPAEQHFNPQPNALLPEPLSSAFTQLDSVNKDHR